MGIPFQLGVQYVLDAQQRYVRAGLPCFLRVKNYTEAEEGDAQQVGVLFAPTGTQSADTGFNDIPIDPPPWVQDVSLHNIGLNAARLQFGARTFKISNTFVQNQLNLPEFIAANVTDPYAVFRQRDGHYVIGLFYNNRLFSIESITHKEIAGATILWYLLCNAHEQVLAPTTGQGGPQ
jgi:hypothetical protein